MTRRGSVVGRLGWVLLAALTGLAVFALTSVTQGACYDSGTAGVESYCTTGPMLGTAGVWVVWILWGLLALFCLYRIVRRGPRIDQDD